jgi:hypothetical protein
MYTEQLKFLIRMNLLFLKSIDKNLETSYKKNMWLLLNELEKPLMCSVFENGRTWRTLKQEFLTVD